MKNTLIALLLLVSSSIAAQTGYLTEWKKKWTNAGDYTLEVAELMPEDLYRYQPTEEQMTFEEQMLHVARQMVWISKDYLDGDDFNEDLEKTGRTKQELIIAVKNSLDYTARTVEQLPKAELDSIVEFFAGSMTKRQMLMLLQDHLTHHRAQMIIYLRLNAVKPPRYRGW